MTVLKMSSPVAPQYLLQGAVYALEQCGLLLRDANILYRSGSYANTVVLAAFAREELGRSKILFDLRKQVLGGKNFTTEDIRKRCDDHVTKQRAGMVSVVLRVPNKECGIGKVLWDRMTAQPQSPEGQKACAELEQITKREKKVFQVTGITPVPLHSMFNRCPEINGTGVQIHLLPWRKLFCLMPSMITPGDMTKATSRLRIQS